ncbi:MAG: hypothetical protein GY862_30785 [Gammaproteobacteria bacterium]|nr:hypothetical protein [Gammaproteobacteria bacterium]
MVDIKQLVTGVMIGAILSLAGAFFLFQGRVSVLETKLKEIEPGTISASLASYSTTSKEMKLRIARLEVEINMIKKLENEIKTIKQNIKNVVPISEQHNTNKFPVSHKLIGKKNPISA